MNAGMPGTGIGGLFYLLSAMLMPIRELFLTLSGRGDAARRKLALRQWLLSGAILAALWVGGTLLGLVPAIAQAMPHSSNPALRVFYVAPVVVAFSTLMAVLVFVEVLRLIVSGRPSNAGSVRAPVERSEA